MNYIGKNRRERGRQTHLHARTHALTHTHTHTQFQTKIQAVKRPSKQINDDPNKKVLT